MTQTPAEDPLTTALRGSDTTTLPSGTKNKALEDEMLEHHRQCRRHKSVLFWGALLVCAALFSLFCYAMLFSDLPLRYLEKSVFSLIPLTLLGAAPLLLLVSLFRCVFRPTGSTDLLDKKDMEAVKDLAAIIKAVR